MINNEVAPCGKKQSLEKVGVTAHTCKTAAQQAAPAKTAATRAAKEAKGRFQHNTLMDVITHAREGVR